MKIMLHSTCFQKRIQILWPVITFPRHNSKMNVTGNILGLFSYSQGTGGFVSLAATVFWAEALLFKQTGSMQPHYNRVTSLILLPFYLFFSFSIPAPRISSHRDRSRVCSSIVRTLRRRRNVAQPGKDSVFFFSFIFSLNCTEDASVTFAEVGAVSLTQRQGVLVEVSENKRSPCSLVHEANVSWHPWSPFL